MAKATAATVVRHAVPLSAVLELIASEVANALHETVSLSQTLGDLTRTAFVEVKKKPDMLEPFVDACKQMCEAHGLTEGSFKVYLSNMRGVLRAMLEGYKPAADATLRAMYDAAPKGTGRQKATGARNSTAPASTRNDIAPGSGDADEGETVKPVNAVNTVSRADAIRALFGHYDDELDAAVSWAQSNEMMFLNYVKAHVAATTGAKPVKRRATKELQAA